MLTNIYDVLRSPRSALQRIDNENDIWKAAEVQSVIFFINGLVNESDGDDPLWLTCIAALLAVPIVLVICAISAGIVHGIARLLGGQGTWRKQFITLGYSMLPQLVFVPLQAGALFLEWWTAVIVLAFIASVWLLVLSVIAVSVTQRLSILRSCVVFFAPMILAIVIIIMVYISIMAL